MLFTPNLKRKRGAPNRNLPDPLPHCAAREEIIGIFNGFSVEVNDREHIRILYESGCFGKGSKSRRCPEFLKPSADTLQCDDDENLVLGLEEAFFLAQYLKILKIQTVDGTALGFKELIDKFSVVKAKFVDCLVGYLYFRSKNWIVKSGIKFGGDFLLYKRGPRHYHASFIVLINRGETRPMKDVKGIHRIAETSDKDVIFLEISPPKDTNEPIDSLESLQKYKVSENIIKRFNYSSFVQTK